MRLKVNFSRKYSPSCLSIIFILLLLQVPSLHADSTYGVPVTSLDQRNNYKKAAELLNAGKYSEHLEVRKTLANYPLYPYLIYNDLKSRLHKLPKKEVHNFFKQYPDSYLATKLRTKWLMTLASQKKWLPYLTDYNNPKNNTKLACYFHWATYQTGKKKEALQHVANLWVVGKSQPEVCDPLFEAWIKAGKLTQEHIWQRVTLLIEKGNSKLASFITKRYLKEPAKSYANLFIKVRNNPNLITNENKLKKKNKYSHEILSYGIKRMARKDSTKAIKLWQRYKKSYKFTTAQILDVNQRIGLRLARRYDNKAAQFIDQVNDKGQDPLLTEWRIRVALQTLNWKDVKRNVELFSKEDFEKDRWQYWFARSLTQTNDQRQSLPEKIYNNIANNRSFYGFMAADLLKKPYSLNHSPVKVSAKTIKKVAHNPSIRRAFEFYLLDQRVNARREWRHATSKFNTEELLAAAKLAKQWSWHRQGIFAMINASEWDDLSIRFPIAYGDLITFYAKYNNLDPNWLFAIARQESAFMPHARSHANARGLLQLLPATAKETAKKVGLPYSDASILYQPEKNVPIGSAYLRMMHERFNNNRIHATAAYNAGPHRVNKWLKNNKHLPYDAWVEIIPFNETRQYVQNVLSFSVIYGQKLNIGTSLIKPNEDNIKRKTSIKVSKK